MATKYNLNTRIRTALRRIWLWSPMRRDALGAARVSRGLYVCLKCQSKFGPKQVQVDHKIPATPAKGITELKDWGVFIERLFVDPTGLVVLCKPCHKEKTDEETKKRKKFRQIKTKKKPKSHNKRR